MAQFLMSHDRVLVPNPAVGDTLFQVTFLSPDSYNFKSKSSKTGVHDSKSNIHSEPLGQLGFLFIVQSHGLFLNNMVTSLPCFTQQRSDLNAQ